MSIWRKKTKNTKPNEGMDEIAVNDEPEWISQWEHSDLLQGMSPPLGCTLAEGIQDIFLSAGMMKLLVQIFTHLSVSDSRKLFLLYSTTVVAKAV